jgi:septum formation protein
MMSPENMKFDLILASASPRRLDLLAELGLTPTVMPADVDESMQSGEPPEAYVMRLAEAKCRAVASTGGFQGQRCLIVAADTAVVVAGRTLGKPSDEAEAIEMLRLLRGRTHEVMTGVFILRCDDGRSAGGAEITRVHFGEYGDQVIHDYIAGGEPLDKAGAYAIQGGGGRLASGVEGSWSNVVGLPLEKLRLWMGEIGIDPARLA